MRAVWLALLGSVMGNFLPLGSATAAEKSGVEEFLVYELVALRVRTRSQGTVGKLFSDDGEELPPRLDLQPVITPFGEFTYSACSQLWSDCGYIRVIEVPQTNPSDPYVDGPSVFRITVVSVAGSLVYRGSLSGSNVPLSEASSAIESPLGGFRRCVRFGDLVWSGWIPDAWLDEAGRADCGGTPPMPEQSPTSMGVAAPRTLSPPNNIGGEGKHVGPARNGGGDSLVVGFEASAFAAGASTRAPQC